MNQITRRFRNFALVALPIIAFPHISHARDLTVVSWGGAYAKSQIEAYHKPWSARTGNRVIALEYQGGLAEVTAQVQSGDVSWDVVDMSLSDAIRACDEGLIEEIDHATLPKGADGSSAEADFIDGALFECGVPSSIFSTVIAYDTKIWGKAPKTVTDFFDIARFPGRRGLRKGARGNFELALMADGVPASDVYEVLATPAGVKRAWAKIEAIKENVVWWEAGAQPMQLLADSEVVMTTSYNARTFNAIEIENKQIDVIWDGQIWDADVWVIPKSSPNRDLALDYLSFATSASAMATQASYISYGPARKSSMPLVGLYQNTEIEMAPHMPTEASNFANALQSDGEFWADNGDELNALFFSWLANAPSSERKNPCLDRNVCTLVPVFFGTNRESQADAKRIRFTKEASPNLTLGAVKVTVPRNRSRGEINRPSGLVHWVTTFFTSGEAQGDPARHFTIPNDGVLVFEDEDEFVRAVKAFRTANTNYADHSFIFIHGYRTTFDAAAYRTAQLAYDLGANETPFGAPFMFSWPSSGSTEDYLYDLDQARFSEGKLGQFLNIVSTKTGAKFVHVIAHSMGNSAFIEMMKSSSIGVAGNPRLSEVIMAAPDVDIDRFVELSGNIVQRSDNVTLYASNTDKALITSRKLRDDKHRAGDVPEGGPAIRDGIESIDVSKLGSGIFEVFSLSHSNYAEDLTLVNDIRMMFRRNVHPPHERNVSYRKVPGNGGDYWIFE